MYDGHLLARHPEIPPMPAPIFYIKKPSGFSQEVDGNLISPILYQPTPDGVKQLCAHYSRKYDIDLRCMDLRDAVDEPDNVYAFFNHLVSCDFLNSLSDNQIVGLILSHGQHHAIPVLINKSNDKTQIVVFDSTSGSRVKGYFRIANLFPDTTFYLNSGTRQVDSSSCMTDGICILKEALQLSSLFDFLNEKRNDTHTALHQRQGSMFPAAEKPKHFILFNIPEQLLLTAQNSNYLSEINANLSIILRGGKTLGTYREFYQMSVSLTKGERVIVAGINSYLFVKARQHKEIFDGILEQTPAIDEQEGPASSALTR